jgi:hypothetical protein
VPTLCQVLFEYYLPYRCRAKVEARPLLAEGMDCAVTLQNRVHTGVGKLGADVDGNLDKQLVTEVHNC